MENSASKRKFRYGTQHWLSKSSAGLLLGFTLSLGLSGLLLRYGFGDIAVFSVQGQLLMWSISPPWLLIFSLSFLFRSGLNAWLYLLLGNAVVWALVFSSAFFL